MEVKGESTLEKEKSRIKGKDNCMAKKEIEQRKKKVSSQRINNSMGIKEESRVRKKKIV